MYKFYLTLTFVFLWSCILTPVHRSFWVLWDVGQGQWITHVTDQTCHHFDMGGEKAPWVKIKKNCQMKMNKVSFSHWDLDHINLTKKAQFQLRNLCLEHAPGGKRPYKKWKYFLKALPQCKSKNKKINEILFNNLNKKETNAQSRVYIYKNKILIPGDSTKKEEKTWGQKLSSNVISHLILGHHGSHSSTSIFLISNLKKLKQALASSRTQKYGHPHLNTVLRLKKYGIPVLSSQEWGNIYFYIE